MAHSVTDAPVFRTAPGTCALSLPQARASPPPPYPGRCTWPGASGPVCLPVEGVQGVLASTQNGGSDDWRKWDVLARLSKLGSSG